ncbi:MAG: SpoIID/LytB domain-containing protein [Bacteroidales bacterium]|jgi:SpoIID/LytB domain protein|nr:SpoIID/LytB domain-containing protein [Bacteroidales bacterium]MDD2264281.1 SpoIID/LytB domain-containing protein [Bacteroidales bacterium]MDD2831515.1 SpoIID/LytB domain-containing protein [Bacteroidales bacterium]MDD3208509.1 SpoIID/LytB domain-containing protein [Bacteroidales bacterium]MDD3697078.1 SpoIID/LytB domain-containing protein [Bacteroidales bacterium]
MGNSGQKTIEVGILLAPSVTFQLDGDFGGYSGNYTVAAEDGQIRFQNRKADRFVFEPADGNASFLLKDVVIGIDFHWERKEDQRFRGSLVLIPENNMVRAVNILPVEDYLISVIASEMSATSSLEYLKAHAVISRSWLLSQIEKRQGIEQRQTGIFPSEIRTEKEWIKWWDREDHTLFDVCADDHCQRYQGITRPSQSLDNVTRAVTETAGEVLTHEGKICDARFSKCCGGIMERFSTSWEPIDPPYLQGRYDGASLPEEIPFPDLSDPVQAEIWIRSTPPAFCNTSDQEVLSQVLNEYDQETKGFYRWEVFYTFEEISDLIKRRTGVDFGQVQELIPLERGTSGRIVRLEIKGTLRTLIIGKDLLIRKALSESHLYSSAFIPVKRSDGFVLYGAGWGHGVGLCQIGGAVMASHGYSYKQILQHYYPGSRAQKIY